MSSHSEGSLPGRVLCDDLRDHLNTLWSEHGGASRQEAKAVCSIGIAGGLKTTYVYHRKTKPGVRIYIYIYIDGDSSHPPCDLPTAIRLQMRPRFQSQWERRFPFFFEIEDSRLVPELASRLASRISNAVAAGRTWRDDTLPAEEVSRTDVWEGAVTKVSVNVYERSAVN